MSRQSSKKNSFLPSTDYTNLKPHRNTGEILEAKRLRPEHARQLQIALNHGTEHIAGYFSWAENAKAWDTKRCLFWIRKINRETLPSEHYAFFLGKELVGIGSLRPHGNIRSVQMAYWVSKKFTQQGIGRSIAKTMEDLAIKYRPYQYIFIDHDSSNRSSGKIPQKLGYKFAGTFDSEIHASKESGLWFSWVKENPRYSECDSERLCELQFAILWCEMMLETQPEIYFEDYEESHSEALSAFQAEKDKVHSKNFGETG
jgi:RimJ/RimL family protein N-acetyltransferase